MMIRAAGLVAQTRRVEGLAGTASVTPDWSQVAQRIREEATDDWNDQVAADRFVDSSGAGPEVTRAKVERVSHDGGRFEVQLTDAQPLSTERLLVATGRRVDLTGIDVDRD